MRRAILPLLLGSLLACGLVLAFLFLRTGPAPVDHDGRASGAVHDRSRSGEEVADLTADAVDRVQATVHRSIEEPEGGHRSGEPAEPGTVRVLVMDGADGRPASGATVRFLGEQRYCERRTDEDGRCEVRLTPDTYEIGAFLEQRERAGAAPTDVTSGAVVDLPALVLQPGTGRIEGQLAGRGVRLDRPFLVELHGDGRHPCNFCRARFAPPPSPASSGNPTSGSHEVGPVQVQANGRQGMVLQLVPQLNSVLEELLLSREESATQAAPPASGGTGDGATTPDEEAPRSTIPESTCSSCGYDQPYSTLQVWPGGVFSFQNLDSSRYRLLARREQGDAPAGEQVIELEPFEFRVVDLLARESCDVDFELRDGRGAPFDGTWWEEPEQEDGAGQAVLRAAKIRYRFFANGRRIAVARAAPAEQPGVQSLATNLSFILSQFQDASAQTTDRDDRERGPDDALWPAFTDPDVRTVSLPLQALADHQHRVDRLPCRRLEVEVACGPWRSGRLPLDLQSTPSSPLVVSLGRDLPVESEEIEVESAGAPGITFQISGLEAMLAPPAEGDG